MKKAKFLKRSFSAVAAFVSALSVVSGTMAFAEVTPNPVISRNCPAYSSEGQGYAASQGNDEHYFSFWNASSPDYLAYDLSETPENERKKVIAVWYNTSSYDAIGMYQQKNMVPSDYTIEANKAPGGEYPEDGWEVLETVKDNTLASRQHLVDFEGYNWIRMKVEKADGEAGKNVSVNFDIHNVSQGVSDSWLFLGDSITAGGMNNCYGTGFATYVNQIDSRYFPIQENGGIGGIRSSDGAENIDRWLSTYPGKYVSIAYGTNDAWGNGGGSENYYNNTKYMVDAVLEAGKVPVLPKIPFSTNPDVANYLEEYNAQIDKLYEEYGSRIVKGPDFYELLSEHTEFLNGDGVHPDSNGYDFMRQTWAKTMYEAVYGEDKLSDYIEVEELSDGNYVILRCSRDAEGALIIPENYNGGKIVEIMPEAFSGCDKITSVTIPGSIENIPTSAFENCRSLRKVKFGEGIKTIGSSAFAGCEKLGAVTIPETVESIGRKAFCDCESMDSITILDQTCEIFFSKDTICNGSDAEDAFFSGTIYGCPLSDAEEFAGLTGYKFENICSEDDLRNYYRFEKKDSGETNPVYSITRASKELKGEVKVPSSFKNSPVISVEEDGFRGNENITSVIIGEGVERLGDNIFSGCTSLEKAELSSTVRIVIGEVFNETPALRTINVDEKNDSLCSDGGVLFSKEMKTLIAYPAARGAKSYRIPETTEYIGSYAFNGCDLAYIDVPKNIKKIDWYAFSSEHPIKITINYPECKLNDQFVDLSGDPANVTISGHKGSTAEAYAEKKGLKFVPIGEETEIVYGDATCDGKVEIGDAVLIMQSVVNKDKYGVGGYDEDALTEQGEINADCYQPGSGITSMDALSIQKMLLGLTALPEK